MVCAADPVRIGHLALEPDTRFAVTAHAVQQVVLSCTRRIRLHVRDDEQRAEQTAGQQTQHRYWPTSPMMRDTLQ